MYLLFSFMCFIHTVIYLFVGYNLNPILTDKKKECQQVSPPTR